ncbi:Disease resistance protein RPP13 [Abeliophyllum distichum]|uniref:Disease resistance protein RPP13 n=1 Tax=Abeliophyllum distichum TaxID=126358 RepID=A0ABD1V6B7_9LAMI
MAPSTYNLNRVLKEYPYHHNQLQNRLIQTAIQFITKLCSENHKIIDLLELLERSAKRCLPGRHSDDFIRFSHMFGYFVIELRVFFTVPNQQLSKTALNPNELLAAFIDFLHQIFEEIQILSHGPYFLVSVKGPIKVLQTELKFLITFLGDTPSQHIELEETKNLLTDIRALVNAVGSFVYKFFVKETAAHMTGLDLPLSDLLQKFELLKTKIKEHCITFPKMQSGTPTKTGVVSPFIVDSLLDDLKDLMNCDSNRISVVKDQILTIHEDFLYLQSFLRVPHVMEKIKNIMAAIQETKKSYRTGILEVADHPSKQVSFEAQKPPIVEDTMVGFKDEAVKISDQLIGGTDQLQIISIFGMPGLGKTTLAKKLYNDPSIVYHFDKRAWCVVSQTYQTRNMLIDILKSISDVGRDKILNMEDEHLAEQLYKSLKGMRYLIVMDDIWNVNAWDDCKRYFPDDRSGSRILFTTRLKDVGLQASSHSVNNALPFLSEVECWDLLQQKVFQNDHCPPELVDIGKQIATYCHGLPLAVVVIAAIVANLEMKEILWQEVALSLSSRISEDPNSKYPLRKLLSLWVAEGFVKKVENKSLEDTAEEYLTDLIDRSLVLVAKRRSNGGIKACNIHDLLREMCLRIADKEKFVIVIKDQISICEQHHRLSIQSNSFHSYSRLFGLHVRSLLGCVLDPSAFDCCNLKLLRILDFSSTGSRSYNPIGIESLVQLRLLAISSIPSSIEIFVNLEFLFVDNKQVVQIPDILLNMSKLRLLHFRGGAKFSESFLRASMDESFQKNNLETVSFLFIYYENNEKFLRCSPHLRRLKCRLTVFWDSFKKDYRYPTFNFFNHLESLSVSFHLSYNIRRDLTTFPSNLRKLTLRYFDLSWKQMRIIGRLPNLQVLKLEDGDLGGKQWDTDEGEFQQLKFLKLDGVTIAHWNASSDHFPRLQHLILRKLQHLKNIPSSLGDIPTLHTIEVHDCKKAVADSATQIWDDQRDMGNEELKLIISDSFTTLTEISELRLDISQL